MEEDPVSNNLWKIVPPILLLVGITGNILAILVLKRLRFRRHPTLTFLMYLAVNDSVVLLTGLPRYWIYYITEYDIRKASNANCKLYYFCIYISMQYSSWILVGVSTERLVKTYFPFRYKRCYTSRKVGIGLLIVLFVLVLVNGHFFFTNGINDYTNGSCGSLTKEFTFYDENIYIYIDFFILCAIPFILMLICNILLVRILRVVEKNRATMMHHSMVSGANKFSVRMTKMLVLCTLYFLIATAPVSVWFILDSYLTPGYKSRNDIESLTRMERVRTITYLIQYTNYCINFYLYTAMNERFSKELKNLLFCKRRYIYLPFLPRLLALLDGLSTSNCIFLVCGISTDNHKSLYIEILLWAAIKSKLKSSFQSKESFE